MADQVKESAQEMPSQDDPANYAFWANFHENKAEEIAQATSLDTEGGRLGQLQGEMDHRATAAAFRDLIELNKTQKSDKEYSEEVKAELKSRGLLPPEPDLHADILEDTKASFRDNGIPEKLAEYAIQSGGLMSMKDPAERESFSHAIADAKRDLEALMLDNGKPVEVEGINDWQTAIDVAVAGKAREFVSKEDQEFVKKVASDIRAEIKAEAASKDDPNRAQWKETIGKVLQSEGVDVRAGLREAHAHWNLTAKDIRLKFPLIENDQDARAVAKAGTWRSSLIAKIPIEWQRRLNLDPERTYRASVEKAYKSLIDQRRDSLLSERSKAMATLRGVDPRIAPHLLPSKQYRAAERLTQVDQQLRKLSPLDKSEYGAAISVSAEPLRATSIAQVSPQQSQVKAPVPAPEKVNDNARVVYVGNAKHERALDAVREIQSQIPVDGYRSKAADAMAKNIVRQLQEGRETISLGAKYAGPDQSNATDTHANAVGANKQLIDVVRAHGIPVDTGKGVLISVKKAEVELGSQVEQDLS